MNNSNTLNDTSPINTTDINALNNPSTPNRTVVVSQSQGSGGIEALIQAAESIMKTP